MTRIERTEVLRRMPAAFALAGVLACTQIAGAGEKSQPGEPDYTKGEKLDKDLNYCALGPTGAIGNVWSGTDTRMVQIREVLKDTPAAGVLEKGDVILGVISPVEGGANKPDTRFGSDARRALSAAITEAERKENAGKLVLNVWRKGKTFPATITLPVKGTYSATSPWACEKTTKIIDAAAQSILTRGFFGTNRKGTQTLDGGIDAVLDALGLLATGEDKYLPAVRTFARTLAGQCLRLDILSNEGMGTWHAGYRNLFLAEYYLVTRDASVLPGINALSTYMALGQSGVGTWSHGMADVQQNGLYGPPCAYGAMNQCSMTCAISLMLAQKCGVKKKEIDDAVKRSLDFYRWFVDKGTVPYGDHPPAEKYDNNGKNSQAAVLFDLAGDKEAAGFFIRSTLASYNDREGGHTGQFFSWQWGALGAARGGPEAAQSFVRNTRYFTELERRPDGGAVYQPSLRKDDHGKYAGWSTTGSRLLQHCLPRKALYITGKEDGCCVPPITGNDLKTVVDAARFNPSGLSVKELLAALGSWSLVLREQAAAELGKRDEDVVQDLIAMLDSPNRYARYGACVGLEYAGRKSDAAVDALMKKVESDRDLTLRYFAVNSLKLRKGGKGQPDNGLGSAVLKATPALLKLSATYEPDQDPGRKLHCIIAGLLFYGGNVNDYKGYFPGGRGTEKLDRALLIPAMKSFLINPNGAARSSASSIYPYLSKEDLESLWGDIYVSAKNKAPSGVMFAGAARSNGTVILAQNGFKEGLPLALDYLYQDGWGKFGRVPAAFEALSNFGSAIKPYLEEMRTREYDPYVKGRKPGEVKACQKAWQKILDNINKAVDLRSIAPYLKTTDPGREKRP